MHISSILPENFSNGKKRSVFLQYRNDYCAVIVNWYNFHIAVTLCIVFYKPKKFLFDDFSKSNFVIENNLKN